MTSVQLHQPYEVEVFRTKCNRGGGLGPVELWLSVTRDVVSGELRYHATLPNAEHLVFPHDLPVLLQVFGLGIYSLAGQTRGAWSFETSYGCADVISKLEYLFRLKPN
jgi:hypothetical protein